jgi:hypothetical protein
MQLKQISMYFVKYFETDVLCMNIQQYLIRFILTMKGVIYIARNLNRLKTKNNLKNF